jgi:hypothetical protein
LPKEGTKNFVFAGLLLEPRLFKLWGLAVFLVWGFAFGGLGLFRAPRCLDPALKQGTKNSEKNRREKRGAPKSAGPVAYAASAIWLIRHWMVVGMMKMAIFLTVLYIS